jgi:general secretion pathway protein A
MHKVFYGFTGEPFARDAGEQALFRHNSFNELSGRLAYIKQHRGIMLVTGEPGTGKTTALRSFFSSLREQSFFPVYLPLSTVGITEFYQQINQSLGGEHSSRKHRLFKSIQERILDLAVNRNEIPVIVIDESHLLKNENFFELQIITNFRMDLFDPCIFILVAWASSSCSERPALAAQSHLNDRLQRSILAAFNQRIGIKYHLFPLGVEECREYILHNFKINGVSREIFTEPALRAIYNISRGIIRNIGKLTTKTLFYGATNKKEKLSEDDVLIASKEI